MYVTMFHTFRRVHKKEKKKNTVRTPNHTERRQTTDAV